ncbi:MAG: glycosyltransferase family 2 protein [Clostridia bacterium]|nr:glycosyltransferase family 2 protein [Clostridia bacterium]
MDKKLLSVCVPVYNEAENIAAAYERITAVMSSLCAYDYEIVFFDDGSTDGSAELIEGLCRSDEKVRAVFYARNFGYSKTVFYCMQQAKGDAAIIVHCDLQNPPEEIPKLVEKWEQGADVALGVKNKSRENRLMYFLRTLAYFVMNFVFGMHMVPHATEFELLDRSVLDVLRDIHTQNPYLRGYILEYGRHIEKVYYVQDKRRGGSTHFNLKKYYEFALGGIVSMSRCLPRRFILFSVISILALLVEFFARFLPAASGEVFWSGLLLRFGVFSALLLILLVSILFEYILTLINNTEDKPFIIEDRRINY